MWNHLQSASMAPGAHHRRVPTRLFTLAAALALTATALPAAVAAIDDDQPTVEVTPVGEDTGPVLQGVPIDLGSNGDRAWTFHDPASPPGALATLRPILVDACASAGSTFLIGDADPSGALDLSLNIPGAPAPFPFEVPPRQPGAEGGGFVFADAPGCDVLHPSRDSRLAPINGVATYDAIGRGCGDFSVDVAFSESRKNRGIDTYTMRGNQVNRVVTSNPLMVADDSKSYDEIHLFTIPDPNDPTAILGAAIGGGPGTLPKGKKLDKAIDNLLADQSQDVVDRLLAQVAANKQPRQFVKGVKAKKNPCTYAVSLKLEKRPDAASFEAFVETLLPAPDPLAADDRFRVDLVSPGGTTAVLAQSSLFSATDPAEEPGQLWFFTPDDWEMLVTVIDGCSFNDHFWVFAAATTDVEYSLAVTDTQSGESRAFGNAGRPADPIMDTSAFSTCP